MAEIIIRWIRGTAWDSRAIEFRTRSWASHTEAIDLSSDSPRSFGAMLKGGVDYRSLIDPCYEGVSRIEEWHIPCTDQQHDYFWVFLLSQRYKKYDWRAILSFGMGERDWEEPDSWFCSELQMAALKAANIWTPAGESHLDRIDPGMAYIIVTSLPGVHP